MEELLLLRRKQRADYMREYNQRPQAHAKKLALDRAYYAAHREERIAYDHERNSRPERIASKRASDKAYRQEHRNELAAYFRQYYEQNKERWAEYNGKPERKTYMSAYLRKYGLRQKYGITVADYNLMFDAQGGVCVLCKLPPQVKSLHVDHDHSTGKIRGLLCTRCNNALERLERYPGWGERAGAYLQRAQ